MLREWSRSNFRPGLTTLCGGRRLSAEPLSYRYFVARTITTTPVQSAMAFPKNDPRCVLGLETLYSPIHNRSTATEAMLSEWRRKKLCCRDICEDSYPRQGDLQLSTHLQRSAAIFGLTTIWRLRLVRQIHLLISRLGVRFPHGSPSVAGTGGSSFNAAQGMFVRPMPDRSSLFGGVLQSSNGAQGDARPVAYLVYQARSSGKCHVTLAPGVESVAADSPHPSWRASKFPPCG